MWCQKVHTKQFVPPATVMFATNVLRCNLKISPINSVCPLHSQVQHPHDPLLWRFFVLYRKSLWSDKMCTMQYFIAVSFILSLMHVPDFYAVCLCVFWFLVEFIDIWLDMYISWHWCFPTFFRQYALRRAPNHHSVMARFWTYLTLWPSTRHLCLQAHYPFFLHTLTYLQSYREFNPSKQYQQQQKMWSFR